jgi:hypothetical protein
MRRLNGHPALLGPRAGANEADLANVRLHSEPGRESGGDGKDLLFGDACRSRHGGVGCRRVGDRRFGSGRFRGGQGLLSSRGDQLLQPVYSLGKTRELGPDFFQGRAQCFGIRIGDRFGHRGFHYFDRCHIASQSGISPCFFGGRSSRLVCRYSSAWDTWRRVSAGSMTASTRRRPAAT